MKTNENIMIAEFMKSDSLPHRYDTDWNWLIPVVEKIEGMCFETVITKSSCAIYGEDGEDPLNTISLEYSKNKIESVYRCVVRFVEWHKLQAKCRECGVVLNEDGICLICEN